MKIGILTFHRVYNYGAVIQAFCTQKILDELNIDNELIDFSILKQRDFTALYSTHNGMKRFIKTLLLLPYHKNRKIRVGKFDDFTNNIMRLSDCMYKNEEDLKETNKIYDVFMVGSDQIWNVTKKAESSDAYFLKFADDTKGKFSYASSIGTADINDLMAKKKMLESFQAVSCREIGGAEILTKVINREVSTVLDPTLLIKKEVLVNIIKKYDINRNYILYYSLDGFDKRKNNLDILEHLSQKYNWEVAFITPEWPKHDFGFDIIDAGPEEFLYLINNANLVCTNSFHGTALSIKLNKEFLVLEDVNSKDERKRSILKQLELEHRIVKSVDESYQISQQKIDYSKVNQKLEELQNNSAQYLNEALKLCGVEGLQ